MGDSSNYQPRLCTVRKWADFAGYGFNLHAERGRAGQYIGKVDDNSPAQAAGMREGDRIVEVNGVNIGNENHSQVVTRIKAGGDHVTMLLVDLETDKYFKEQKVVISNEMAEVARMETPPRPAEGDQEPESEPAVEVPPVSQELDQVNEEAEQEIEQAEEQVEEKAEEPVEEQVEPVEEQVEPVEQNETEAPPPPPEDHEDSPAGSVHSAEPDEIINEVTEQPEEQPEELPEPDAIDNDTPPPPPEDEPPSYEREPTPEPPRDPSPEPEVLPVPDTTPSHNYHPRLCYIKKWADFQGYGFNLHAEKDKQGQYIGLVDDNSPAEDAGLKKGDRIIEVNGVNIEDESHQQVIQRIKAGGETTKMLVVDSETDEFYKNNGLRIHANLPEVKYKETSDRQAKVEPEVVESEPMKFTPRQCHIVKWADFNGYGFNLHAEKERGGQYIGKIDANSPAEDGGLRENDRIIEVNGVNIENETHQQVIGRIKAGGDETKLLVVDREADAYYKSKGITVSPSLSEVKFMETSRRSPRAGAPAVANGDTTPSTQPTRTEPVKEPTAQANGGDFLNMSAKEMRERLAQKKKYDPKQKSNLDFKSKYDIFQKM